jgi:hypothetical protein
MKWYYFIVPLFFLAGDTLFLSAQTDSHGKNIVYSKESHMGFNLNTNGLGFIFRKGDIKDIYHTAFWELEVMEVKHPKEFKQKNEDIDGAKGFSFGKQNNFYVINAGYTISKLLFRKSSINGVRITYNYGAGLSLGILKPYYLNVLYPSNFAGYYEIVQEKYDSNMPSDEQEFMNWYSIYGASGFKYGLGELRPLPGGYTRASIQFEWGEYLDVVKALEVGLCVEVYPSRVPIMIIEENRMFFFTLYISLQIGKRKVN